MAKCNITAGVLADRIEHHWLAEFGDHFPHDLGSIQPRAALGVWEVGHNKVTLCKGIEKQQN